MENIFFGVYDSFQFGAKNDRCSSLSDEIRPYMYCISDPGQNITET